MYQYVVAYLFTCICDVSVAIFLCEIIMNRAFIFDENQQLVFPESALVWAAFLEGRVQSLVVKAMKVLYDTIAGFYGRAVIYIGVWVIYTSLFYVTITI